jgi:hypothetical protein
MKSKPDKIKEKYKKLYDLCTSVNADRRSSVESFEEERIPALEELWKAIELELMTEEQKKTVGEKTRRMYIDEVASRALPIIKEIMKSKTNNNRVET